MCASPLATALPVSDTVVIQNTSTNELVLSVGAGTMYQAFSNDYASATITRTLFVGLAMIESIAIYCFVVSMILLFANPFWNHVIAQVAGK